jgi:hypothetical protein
MHRSEPGAVSPLLSGSGTAHKACRLTFCPTMVPAFDVPDEMKARFAWRSAAKPQPTELNLLNTSGLGARRRSWPPTQLKPFPHGGALT